MKWLFKGIALTSCILSYSLNANLDPQFEKELNQLREISQKAIEQYKVKRFPHVYDIPDMAAGLFDMHFRLYKGYVNQVNLLSKMIRSSELGKSSTYRVFQGPLKKVFGWEYNGMRLHELYFENFGPALELDDKSALMQLIGKNFSSYEDWVHSFKSTGLTRGIGWVILFYDKESGQLFNAWISEHDEGLLSEAIPLLVMDVWEHAYIPQFGLDRAQYIDVFMKNINWDVVSSRLHIALCKNKVGVE